MSRRSLAQIKRVVGGLTLIGISLIMALAGCDKKEEKVFDLEAPGVDIEVMKSDDGEEHQIEIETEAEREN